MFTTTTTNLIIGISVCVIDYTLNKNKAKIWKLFHKRDYIYLTRKHAWCGIYSQYDNWVSLYAWSCFEDTLNKKYESTLAKLLQDEIYQKAPFEIQIETKNRIYDTYLWSRKLAGIE